MSRQTTITHPSWCDPTACDFSSGTNDGHHRSATSSVPSSEATITMAISVLDDLDDSEGPFPAKVEMIVEDTAFVQSDGQPITVVTHLDTGGVLHLCEWLIGQFLARVPELVTAAELDASETALGRARLSQEFAGLTPDQQARVRQFAQTLKAQ